MSEPMTDLMTAIEKALGDVEGLRVNDDEWRLMNTKKTRRSILAALRPAVEQWMQEHETRLGLQRRLSAAVPAPLDEAAERERFERIAKAPPFEWECARFSDSPDDAAWPGQYRRDETQAAWEFWLAAKRDERGK